MARLSIRARLTSAFAASLLLILALAAVFAYVRVQDGLAESLDESLQARADDVAAAVATRGSEKVDLRPERLVEGEDGFTQVLKVGDAAGSAPAGRRSVVASTLPAEAGAAISPEEAGRAAEAPLFVEDRALPGITGEARILARSVTAGGGESVVVVGATTEDNVETLRDLRNAFLIGAPIAVLLASGLGYLLAGRAMAPVEAMRGRAEEITLEHSGERLPLPAADDEVRQLGETLNAMLDRIEGSLQRERVFVADASHELRTPLAILRAELELADRPGRSTDEVRAALRSAAVEVDRLSRLAEDLLVIARSDRGELPIATERVALGALLERVRERFRQGAADAGRRIVVDSPASAVAELDRLRIEQAIGNLLDNALRHGEGQVRLAGRIEGTAAVLEVTDEGGGFADGFAPRAFDRFTRADQGRTGHGAGLGLAIVRAIAEAHGGGADIEGASVRITLPGAALPGGA